MFSIRLGFFLLVAFIIKGVDSVNGQCCRRVPDIRIIGHDITGRTVKLDVGRCSRSCQDQNNEFGQDYQSVLDRILEKKVQRETGSCYQAAGAINGESECRASLIRVETVTLATGPQLFDVIESCECQKVAKTCEKVSKKKKFFPGTEFEAIVDVGECQGSCRSLKHHKICRETRTTTHSIRGPNGDISVHAVAQCSCEQACYRQHFNVAVTELFFPTNGQEFTKTKLVDVGKCVGSCGPIKRCVVRDHKSKDGVVSRCLMSLETSDVKCSPTRIHDVTFTNRNGLKSHLTQIRKCGCS